MNSPTIGGCCLNPYGNELTYQTKSAATIFSALMAIVALSGVLIILASQGANIGAFNSLSKIGVIGGGLLALIGGMPLLMTFAWIIASVQQPLPKRIGIRAEHEKVEESHLTQIFLDNQDDDGVIGTSHFKTLEEKVYQLHFTEEATFNNIVERVALSENTSPDQITLIFGGKELDKRLPFTLDMSSPWKNVCSHYDINYRKGKEATPVVVALRKKQMG